MDCAATPLLLDASRLVWRRWVGRPPTGIDRVCLAYCARYAGRAQAVVQWRRGTRGRIHVLSPALSAHLFALLLAPGDDFRARFLRLAPRIAAAGGGGAALAGRIYLNIGHTGLDDPALPQWVGRSRVRAVFLLHDLIPLTHPEFCRAGEAERHRARIAHALGCATGIIANSAATLNELDAHARAAGLPRPPTVAAWISGHEPPATITPARFDRPWFVTVGTIEGRKNHALLLQVWQRLAAALGAQTPLLVIVGARGWEADLAQALIDRGPGLAGHVIERAGVDDAALAGLIAGARALLMPSFAEGFGLPVIEALQLGTPVITSNLPVFAEIAGTIPTMLDPTDGPGWLAAIRAFLGDGRERARQIAAMAGFRAPDWPGHFAVVEPWLESLGAAR